jgi:hypothetical protein
MATRRFGNRTFTVTTQRIRRDNIVPDTTYQRRIGDNPWVRGDAIKTDVLRTQSTSFRTNPVVYKVENLYYLLDGYGRYNATGPDKLNWKEFDVDVLHHGHGDEAKFFIAAMANEENCATRSTSAQERNVNIYEYSVKFCKTARQIANEMQLSIDTIYRSLRDGRTAVENMQREKSNVSNFQIFPNRTKAMAAALKIMSETLEQDFESWSDLQKYLGDEHHTVLSVQAADNSSARSIAFDYLDAHGANKPDRFLVLLYCSHYAASTEQGKRIISRLAELCPGKFVALDLADSLNKFNPGAVREFLEVC